MRARRTPAPHTSRPRGIRLRGLVAALLTVPLALGTLAATALPSAATVPATIAVDGPITAGVPANLTLTCPASPPETGFSYGAKQGSTLREGLPISAMTEVGVSTKSVNSSLTFPKSGEWVLYLNCYRTQDSVERVVTVAASEHTPATWTSVAFSPATIEPQSTVHVEANIWTTNGPAAGGTVRFSPGDVVASVNQSGKAVADIPNPGPGILTVTADYSGTEWFESSWGTGDAFVKATAVVTATVPSRVTAPHTVLHAAVETALGSSAATGNITFEDSEGVIGTAQLVNGAATLTLPDLAPGEYTNVTAVYSGNGSYGTGRSTSSTMTIDPELPIKNRSVVTVDVPTTVTGTQVPVTVSVDPGAWGRSISVASMRMPSGTVTVMLTPGGHRQDATLIDGRATLAVDGVAPGTYQVSASYAGDEYYDGAVSSSATTIVSAPVTPEAPKPLTPVVTVPDALTTAVATQVTFTVGLPATARPTGAVTVSAGTTLLTTTTVPASGDLSITLPVLSPGTHDLVVRTSASTTVNATEHPLRVTVTGEPATSSPSPNAALTGSTSTLVVGDQITLVARGFLPGEVVAFFAHSDPIFLGTAVADADGVATLVVSLPAGIPSGQHHVQATGGTSGRWAEIPVTVSTLAAAPVAPTAALATTGAPVGSMLTLALVLAASGALLLAGRRRMAVTAG